MSSEFLSKIIDHFAESDDGPPGDWAHDTDCSSYALEHRGKDGTRFWIDLDKDGTISVLWKPAGMERPEVKIFRSE